MTSAHPHATCTRCGRELGEGKADPLGWCAECRAEVVRRATPFAWGAAVLVGLAYLLLLGWTGALATTNFLVFWLALGALLVFGAFKVARRVAFDLIRARALRSSRR